MTHEEYFEKYGKVRYNVDIATIVHLNGHVPTEEERYQAFRQRMKAEDQKELAKSWGMGSAPINTL